MRSEHSRRPSPRGARVIARLEGCCSEWKPVSMAVARGRADRVEDGAAALLERAAHLVVLAEAAHLALPLHGGGGHVRLNAELAQRVGNFLHLGGAPHAVARHAFEVV